MIDSMVLMLVMRAYKYQQYYHVYWVTSLTQVLGFSLSCIWMKTSHRFTLYSKKKVAQSFRVYKYHTNSFRQRFSFLSFLFFSFLFFSSFFFFGGGHEEMMKDQRQFKKIMLPNVFLCVLRLAEGLTRMDCVNHIYASVP